MSERFYIRTIWTFSILIPLAIALMLSPGFPQVQLGFDTSILPKINAFINSCVAILLVIGFVFIKRAQMKYHRAAMITAFVLSACFLITYVLYHISTGHTPYCENGPVPNVVYYMILISHIGLSSIILPLALFTLFRGLSQSFEKHKRIAGITFPIWLYVAITGVLVYVFISPCY